METDDTQKDWSKFSTFEAGLSVRGWICSKCGNFVPGEMVHICQQAPTSMTTTWEPATTIPSEEIQLLREIRDLLKQLIAKESH